MTRRKGLIVGGSVLGAILFTPLIALAVLLSLGQEQYRSLTLWAVEQATGATVGIDGPFHLQLGLTVVLKAEGVSLGGAGGGALHDRQGDSVTGRIESLEVEADLRPLLDGYLLVSHLRIETVDLLIARGQAPPTATDDSRSDGPAEVKVPAVLPILADTVVNNVTVRLVAADGRENSFVLDTLTLAQDGGDREVRLAATGTINAVEGRIEGRFGSVPEAIDPTRPYPIDLSWHRDGLRAAVRGVIDVPERDDALDIAVTLEADDAARLGDLAQQVLPSIGPLRASARVVGPPDTAALEDLSVVVAGPEGPRLSLTGRVGQLNRLDDVRLAGTVSIADRTMLRRWADHLGLGPVGDVLTEISASVRAEGGPAGLALRDLSATVRGGDDRLLAVEGAVGDILRPSGVDLAVAGRASDRAMLAGLLSGAGVDLAPSVVGVAARIHDEGGALRVDVSRFEALDGSGLALVAAGEVRAGATWADLATASVDFRCRASAPDVTGVERLFDEKLPDFGALEAEFQVIGPGEDPEFRNLRVRTADGSPVELQLTGARLAHLFAKDKESVFEELRVTASALALTPILALFDEAPPPGEPVLSVGPAVIEDPGPVSASALVKLVRDPQTGERQRSLEEVTISIGRPQGLQIGLAGRVGAVGGEGRAPVREIDASVTVSMANAGALVPELGIPGTQPVRLEGGASLGGGLDRLTITDLDLEFRSDTGVTGLVTGVVGRIPVREDGPVGGIDLKISLTAPSVDSISDFTGEPMPEFGAIRADGRLHGDERRLALDPFRVDAGADGAARMTVTGRVGDVVSPSGLQARVSFSGRLADLAAPWTETPLNTTMTLHGGFELADTEGGIRISDIDVRSAPSDDPFFELTGSIGDAIELEQVDVVLSGRSSDISMLAPLFDLEDVVPPARAARIDGRMAGDRGRVEIDATANLGGSDLKADVILDLGGDRPSLAGTLVSEKIELSDLGWVLETPDPAELETSAADSGHVIPDEPLPVETLRAVDLDLKIRLGTLTGETELLGELETDIRLLSGRLRVLSDFRTRKGGRLKGGVQVDANVEPPTLQVNGTGHDVRAENLLYFLGQAPLVEGSTHSDIDIRSAGRSPRELAAGMSGRFGLALDEGRLDAGDLRLLSPGLFWLAALAEGREYTDLDCGLFQFSIANGLAVSRTMLLVTAEQTVVGSGRIDFRDETLDISVAGSGRILLPQLSKPFKVSGPWRKPAVDVAAVGLIADTALNIGEDTVAIGAGIASVPLQAVGSLGRLLGIGSGDSNRGSNRSSVCLKHIKRP